MPKTDFWKRFPPREEIEKQIRCDPDECIYYAKNGEQNEVDDSSSSSENSDKADRSSAKCKRPRKNLPRSVVDFALESLLRAAKKPRL